MILSDIEIILGQLEISNWGETVFDYLPNLMYVGGFEGNSSLTSGNPDSFGILDNIVLEQVHFPKLVQISGLNATVTNNPNLCFIGDVEYYLAPGLQVVDVDPSSSSIRSYGDCGKYSTYVHCYVIVIRLYSDQH